jgi:nitrite reductase/ring-hydroxylating ferredoxin subunit
MLALCGLEEIPDGSARGFAVEGPDFAQRIVVARRGDAIYGYVNSCPHALSRLDHTLGAFMDDEDRHLYCAAHGALFRVEDGVCVEGPCLGEALAPARVVLIDGGVCLDRMGVRLVGEISKVLSDFC